MSTRPPPLCAACQVNRAAWTHPVVAFCYSCLPGGPFTPPACRSCGSTTGYFSQGQCELCHTGAPQHLESRRDCLAFGVLRAYSWRCWTCRGWHARYPKGHCPYCGRDELPIGKAGACRLCWEQAHRLKEPGRPVDLAGANRYGQQLFLANLTTPPRTSKQDIPASPAALRPAAHISRAASFTPVVRLRQDPLFYLAPNLIVLKTRAQVPDEGIARYCDAILREHAERHGWSVKHVNDVKRSLKLIQALQGTPGAPILASEIAALRRHGVTVQSTLDVLAAADLLIDDRVPAIHRYFAAHTAGFPDATTRQLQYWFTVMLDGSDRPPRRIARHPDTVRIHLRAMLPALRTWTAAGHDSLAEITSQDVTAVLPPPGPGRVLTEIALRSLFEVLKSGRNIFANPMRGLPISKVNETIPLPLDTDAIRVALNSPDPAAALAVAFVAFHAVTQPQLRAMTPTDIQDGRLHIDGRAIPLAAPVRVRLAAYLDHRSMTYPGSINPHLFINRRSAPRLTPVGRQFPWTNLDVRPQALREDRILQEIHATGGDVRRICDLFGIGIDTALRYTAGVQKDEGTQ
jgi:hypothetical protein